MTLIWDQPISVLAATKKIPIFIEKLRTNGFPKVSDLLWHLPTHKEYIPALEDFSIICEGEFFQGQAKVLSVQARPLFGRKGKGRALLYQVTVKLQNTSHQEVQLVWFNCYSSMKDKLKNASQITFLGKAQIFAGRWQFTNPEFNTNIEPLYPAACTRQVYPAIQGVPTEKIIQLLNKVDSAQWDLIDDIIPEHILKQRNLIPLATAFKILHGKIKSSDLDKKNAEDRLAYEEFFLVQVKIQIRRTQHKSLLAPIYKISDDDLKSFIKLFPYQLTDGQLSSLEDIKRDLCSGHPMNRLLQGDVGSGKTTVALLASAVAFLNGKQSAIMCPTEVLALQHFQTASEIFANSPLKVQLLLGGSTTKDKRAILADLASGKIHLIIGTHALIQESVHFQDLGLAIVDEQHRFGVEQRLTLLSKGQGVHGLIMTATPIPRSLSLTQFGDLDVSVIRHLPSGRKGISTRIINPDLWPKFLAFIKTRVQLGEQIYIVVPAIDENPDMDLLALEKVEVRFKKIFSDLRIGCLHGRMLSTQKNEILRQFQTGEIQILIATSVVEVGISIPNATVMSILNPERFGLSSLHQLRGPAPRKQYENL